jgi:hypothetical protein
MARRDKHDQGLTPPQRRFKADQAPPTIKRRNRTAPPAPGLAQRRRYLTGARLAAYALLLAFGGVLAPLEGPAANTLFAPRFNPGIANEEHPAEGET